MGPELEEVWTEIWSRLQVAVSDTASPWHLPVVGTASASGDNLRTVVLREADPEVPVLGFYSDVRSSKIEALCIAPRIDWLFYDPVEAVQLRVTGPASLHTHDPIADAAWAALAPAQRIAYATESPPGTPTDRATHGLPFGLPGREPSETESEVFRQHFAVIRCYPAGIQWLRLGDEGQLRARFRREGGDDPAAETSWTATWLVP